MKKNILHLLLINPWIHDFAAYDFWAKPLGLLTLAAILIKHGCKVSYIDCLKREGNKVSGLRDGRGPYIKTCISNPKGLEDIPRKYCRYGILPEDFKASLLSIKEPDIILVTSSMTYQYPGVFKTIKILKKFFNAPIILGGIYATLCTDHAKKYSGADMIVSGPGEPVILKIVEKYTGVSLKPNFNPFNINTFPRAAFDLYKQNLYIPIMTSRGCPFSCDYCASGILNSIRMERDFELVLEEIIFWHNKRGILNFAFYDDALLFNAADHVIPLLKAIIDADIKVNFHTPNALHIRKISKEIARLMFKAGFKTIRLGLETINFENRRDKKVNKLDFYKCVENLKSAGFKAEQIGAYILVGLPGQTTEFIQRSIQAVDRAGITPVPALYTPIPKTGLWEKAVACSRYDLNADPIFTNNSILPCSKEPFSWEAYSRLIKQK